MITQIAQITGLVCFIALMVIKTFIIASGVRWAKYGRAIGAWIIIYLWFLVILRGLSLFNIGSREQLMIIAGFSTAIPLVFVLINLFLINSEDTPVVLPTEDKKLEVRTEIKVKK